MSGGLVRVVRRKVREDSCGQYVTFYRNVLRFPKRIEAKWVTVVRTGSSYCGACDGRFKYCLKPGGNLFPLKVEEKD